jgi:hypothetical protein
MVAVEGKELRCLEKLQKVDLSSSAASLSQRRGMGGVGALAVGTWFIASGVHPMSLAAGGASLPSDWQGLRGPCWWPELLNWPLTRRVGTQ